MEKSHNAMSRHYIWVVNHWTIFLPSAAGGTESPKAQKDESTTSTVEEKTEKSEDENDVWNKLKDFAG